MDEKLPVRHMGMKGKDKMGTCGWIDWRNRITQRGRSVD